VCLTNFLGKPTPDIEVWILNIFIMKEKSKIEELKVFSLNGPEKLLILGGENPDEGGTTPPPIDPPINPPPAECNCDRAGINSSCSSMGGM